MLTSCRSCTGSSIGRFITLAAIAAISVGVLAGLNRQDGGGAAGVGKAAAGAAAPKAPEGKPGAATATPVGDPYPLSVCVVAGEPLGDKAVTIDHEGREMRFCCEKCLATFKTEPAKYLAEADRKIIEQQKSTYPLTHCFMMPEEELVDADAVEFVFNNRYVRVCCGGCAKKFNRLPAEWFPKLDAAVIAARKPGYTLETCPVSGEKLGSMGEPVDIVIANRLVRLCCKGCVAEARKDPAKVLAKLPTK